jgi:hypothetical protein
MADGEGHRCLPRGAHGGHGLVFLSPVLTDELDHRDRCSAELRAHATKFDLSRQLDAFSTPEPRILRPLLWLVVDSTR